MPALRKHLTTTNLWRFLLLIFLGLALHHLTHEKLIREVIVKSSGKARNLGFKEFVHNGLWMGAAARAGIAALLLGLSFVRSREGAIAPLRLNPVRSADTRFAIVLAFIVLGALFMRLPRMTHSFWGDEADAVACYVHGKYVPATKDDLQGELKFIPVTWSETWFGGVHGANNHVLFSLLSRSCLVIWRAVTHQPESAFTEWVTRVPSLLGGLFSLVALALLLRRWGVPWMGLLAAAFMALHPWHMRYSTEARGYSLMLALFPLLLHALTNALESNRWRHWVAFAIVEFLLMYSWAGVVYAVAAVNISAAVFMLLSADRWHLALCWITANLLAGAAFISFYAPIVPQIANAREHLLWIKGMPMDVAWLHNVMVAPFAGIPFHQVNITNPAEVSWQASFAHSPVLTAISYALIFALLLSGMITLWKRNRTIAVLVISVIVSAAVCCLHFYFVIKDELRIWYLVFIVPSLSICLAAGAQSIASRLPSCPVRSVLPFVFLLIIAAAWWPTDISLMSHPQEDYHGAVAASRGQHESFAPTEKSNIFTCWLWRYSPLYDPRGDTHVRDAVELRQRMAQAKNATGELYVIVGYRDLAESFNADMMKMLDDPTLFDKRETFPSRESIHTLEVYRMK